LPKSCAPPSGRSASSPRPDISDWEETQARLTPHNAVTEIDRLILTAWRKLPVYMELPSDIAYLDIEVPDAPLLLAQPPSDPERLQSCAAAIAGPPVRRQVTGDPGRSGRGPVQRRG
jgi:hypothetical protein